MKQNKKRYIWIILLLLIVLLSILFYFFFGIVNRPRLRTPAKDHAVPNERSLVQGIVQEVRESVFKKTKVVNEKLKQADTQQEISDSNKKAEVLGTSHSSDEAIESIWKVEYSLINEDQQYGFSIPSVSIEVVNGESIQLYKNTELETQSIYVADVPKDIGEIASYDLFSKSEFQIRKTYLSVVTLDDIQALAEILDSFSIPEHYISENLLTLELKSSLDYEFHQPIQLRLTQNGVQTRPLKTYQFFDQVNYFQFSNHNFSRLVSFSIDSLFKISDVVAEICVHPKYCKELKLE